MNNKIQQGDFTHLAENYALYRPGYSQGVCDMLIGSIGKDNIDFADVGAGTGIWTRIVAQDARIGNVVAVEPNENMRAQGQSHDNNHDIDWRNGSAENTNLETSQYDLVSMASSFHWADFDIAMKEFARILKPQGRFVALWNPRYIDDNPILVDIEHKLKQLAPNLKRVSSGKSDFVEQLADKLASHDDFENFIYLEGKHAMRMTKEQYIGAWRSVNDVQSQLGNKFDEFIGYIDEKIADHPYISATYLTRAFTVTKK